MADSRIMMNIKGIGGSLIPRWFFQRKLDEMFQEILQYNDKTLEEIYFRVNYYNKLKQSFAHVLSQAPEKEKLGKLPFKKTSLAYDGYAISKYFSDHYFWIKSYGDINYCLNKPSVCKDRPIEGDNQNNVLLKLDKNRYFIFLKDLENFEDKKNIAVFRGACYQPLRKNFMQKHFNANNCDIGDTARNACEWKKSPMCKTVQIHNKFILSLEGNTFASNLIWAMSSNSLVIAPKMKNETWLMEGKLKPNYHYAHLQDDFDNLQDLIEYYSIHTKEAKEIIQNAHDYLQIFQDQKKEQLIGILVLAKYLYLSEQMDLSKEILHLMELG